MPYSNVWNEGIPLSSAAAASIATLIDTEKLNMRERLAGIFGLTALQWAADPIVPISLTLTGALTAGSVVGPLTGSVTGTILTPAQANITSLGTLVSLGVTGTVTAGAFSGPLTGNVTGNLTGAVTGNVAGNLTGTVLTAAQPNITSLGAVASLVTSGSAALFNNSQTTGYVYVQLASTAGSSYFANESSVAGTLVGGSSIYATLLGTNAARSLQLFTNNTVRQTIDSAGNVTFTGTVTAANFVGPTQIAGTALTGTVLATNIVTSSLTSVGTLTSLSVAGTASVSVTFNTTTGATTDLIQLYLQRGGVNKWRLGTNINSTNTDAFNIYSEVLGGFPISIASATGIVSAVYGIVANVTGNLTGTVLTAAQGNITSLGLLTSLTVSGSITNNTAILVQKNGSDAVNVGPYFQFVNVASTLSSQLQLSASGHLDFWSYNAGWILSARMTLDNRFLVGTTSITNVAAGGIGVAGNSRFDGIVTFTQTGGSQALFITGGTTGYTFVDVTNTTGLLRFGVERSTGGGLFTGSSAYASVIGSNTATDFMLYANGALRLSLNSAGTVSIFGATTFNAAVSGITTLTATTIYGTLATAAQGNITSVGTLAALAVSGIVDIGFQHLKQGTSTAAVSTVSTVIQAISVNGNVVKVYGTDGTNSFMDEVFCTSGGSFAVVNAGTGNILGAPGTRAYSVVAGNLKLAMSAGSYTVKTSLLEIN